MKSIDEKIREVFEIETWKRLQELERIQLEKKNRKNIFQKLLTNTKILSIIKVD